MKHLRCNRVVTSRLIPAPLILEKFLRKRQKRWLLFSENVIKGSFSRVIYTHLSAMGVVAIFGGLIDKKLHFRGFVENILDVFDIFMKSF